MSSLSNTIQALAKLLRLRQRGFAFSKRDCSSAVLGIQFKAAGFALSLAGWSCCCADNALLPIAQVVPEAHNHGIAGIHFVARDKELLTIDHGKEAKVWSIPEGKLLRSTKIGDDQYLNETTVDSSRTHFAFAGKSGRCSIYDIAELKERGRYDYGGGIIDVDFHPAKTEVLINDDRQFTVLDYRTGKVLRQFDQGALHDRVWSMSVAFISSKEFVTCGGYGEVHIWDYETGKGKFVGRAFKEGHLSDWLPIPSAKILVLHSSSNYRKPIGFKLGDATTFAFKADDSTQWSPAQNNFEPVNGLIQFGSLLFDVKTRDSKGQVQAPFSARTAFSTDGTMFAIADQRYWKVFRFGPSGMMPANTGQERQGR